MNFANLKIKTCLTLTVLVALFWYLGVGGLIPFLLEPLGLHRFIPHFQAVFIAGLFWLILRRSSSLSPLLETDLKRNCPWVRSYATELAIGLILFGALLFISFLFIPKTYSKTFNEEIACENNCESLHMAALKSLVELSKRFKEMTSRLPAACNSPEPLEIRATATSSVIAHGAPDPIHISKQITLAVTITSNNQSFLDPVCESLSDEYKKILHEFRLRLLNTSN